MPVPPTPEQIAELAAHLAARGSRVRRPDSYGPRYLQFVRAHWEAFKSAELDQSSSSSSEMARLAREFQTLPPRHNGCSCWCPQERRGYKACAECLRLRAASVRQDVARGVSSRHVIDQGTVPSVVVLDLEAGYAA